MTDVLHPTPNVTDEDRVEPDLPPLYDPYFYGPAAAPPPSRLSRLAVTSMIALLVPLIGGIAAIVFGLVARREIKASGSNLRGHRLALVGILLGINFTMIWGAALSLLVWTDRYRSLITSSEPIAAAQEPAPPPHRDLPPSVGPTPAPAPSPKGAVIPGYLAPKSTTTKQEGGITLVDVGVSASSLSEALAKQRAEASTAGETMLVMTTASRCDPCQDVEKALRDPLMQTALARVRLVRVDTSIFADDLAALKIPADKIPGFFVLSVNLTPRDGIDGGEWDDDIAQNIAPVLGSFVRGKYTARRETWKALPGSGMRL